MLERTAACIKAGARDSLKCAQQSPWASTRRLHQAFWTHGAGDLDLLPTYVPSPSTPATGLPVRRNDTHSERQKDRTKEPASLAADAIFLDFLYPPQALAYVHRTSRQQLDSWEKRNARRLPEGFVQTSRRFSSKSGSPSDMEDNESKTSSMAQPPGDGNASGTGEESSPRPHGGLLGESEDTIEREARLYRGRSRKGEAGLAQDLEEDLMAAGDAKFRTLKHQVDGHDQNDSGFASSPTYLAEGYPDGFSKPQDSLDSTLFHDIEDTAHDPTGRLRHLRQILGMQSKSITTSEIRQAWRLYLSLADVDKQDARLKEKLLVWLDERTDDLADAHMFSLYCSIPIDARTLITYQTVARSFVRRREIAMLHAMHKEALRGIPNGQQITFQLFEEGLRSRDWTLSRRVVLDHDKILTNDGRPQQIQLFWAKVPGIQDLVDLVTPVVKTVTSDARFRWDWSKNSRRAIKVYLRLSKEAIQQATDLLFVEKFSHQHAEKIFHLLGFINKLDGESHQFFHEMLTRLLPRLGKHLHEQNDPESGILREDAHAIISYLYWHYREGKGAKLHPDLMLIWLEHLTKRMQRTNIEVRSERNVTANMVIEDWQPWHAQLSVEAAHQLITYSAYAGAVKAVKRWVAYVMRRYPAYQEEQKTFWAQIYVHTTLSNLSAAKKAFNDVQRSARAHGDRLDLKCWNVLLHAHQKADDLEGAIKTFAKLVQFTSLTPDISSFDALLIMLARRGDVDAISDILKQYDVLTQGKRVTWFVNMQLRALIFLDDVPRAELLLAETMHQVRNGEVIGSMTECYNTLMSKYASDRDMDGVMHTYRRMKEERIRRNKKTYQHMMQALANFRRTSAAWAILIKVMKADGFEPTAKHYTVAMAGFCNQNEPEKAIMVHNRMLAANIRQSVDTKAALIRAKGLVARKARNEARLSGQEYPDALASALTDLRDAVDNIQLREVANAGNYTVQDAFSPTMWLLGGERHLEAVQRLFQQSKEIAEKYGHSPWPTIRLSAALMNAMYHAKEHAQVEAYWKVVKDQADSITPLTTIPNFIALREKARGQDQVQRKTGVKSTETAADDQAEVGFVTSENSTMAQVQTVSAEPQLGQIGPRPAPARRHVLNRTFKIYLASLVAQNRVGEAIKEANRLLTQGYTFDNVTWNRLVQSIAGSNPPLTLLSFTLTERYLIQNFPGWVGREARKFWPRKPARDFGMEYIRARYLAKTELMPQYRTFIWLAKAFLNLQRRETVGWQGDDQGNDIDPFLENFVGTLKQVRETAPRTLHFVQLMPRIDDKWQNRLLRGIGWDFPPGSDSGTVIGDARLEEPNVLDAKLSTEASSDEEAVFQVDADIEPADDALTPFTPISIDADVHTEVDSGNKGEQALSSFLADVGIEPADESFSESDSSLKREEAISSDTDGRHAEVDSSGNEGERALSEEEATSPADSGIESADENASDADSSRKRE